MSTEKLDQILVSAFPGLLQSERDKIAPALAEVVYPEGHVVFKQKDKEDSFYIVRSGQVRVTGVPDGETESKFFNTIGPDKPSTPGSAASTSNKCYFGETALINECTRTATVTCTMETTLLFMNKSTFNILMGETNSDEANSIQKNGSAVSAAVDRAAEAKLEVDEAILTTNELIDFLNFPKFSRIEISKLANIGLLALNFSCNERSEFAMKLEKLEEALEWEHRFDPFANFPKEPGFLCGRDEKLAHSFIDALTSRLYNYDPNSEEILWLFCLNSDKVSKANFGSHTYTRLQMDKGREMPNLIGVTSKRAFYLNKSMQQVINFTLFSRPTFRMMFRYFFKLFAVFRRNRKIRRITLFFNSNNSW